MVKLTFALRRAKHLSREEFQRYWRERHAPLVEQHREALGIRRYVQNYVVGTSPGAPAWDAVAQLHFASESDLRERFYRDEESPAVIAADVARFADTRSGLVLVTRALAAAGAGPRA